MCSITSAAWIVMAENMKEPKLELDMEQHLIPNKEMSTSQMYIVTLLIQLICRIHYEKHWAGRSTSWNQDCREK